MAGTRLVMRFVSRLGAALALLATGIATPAVAADDMVPIRLFGHDPRRHEVILDADAPLTSRPFHLSGPERWVIDFPGTLYLGARTALPGIPGTSIRGVRIRQNEAVGGVRVVFDLTRTSEFTFTSRPIAGGKWRHAFLVDPEPGTPTGLAPAPDEAPRVAATPRPVAVSRPRPVAPRIRPADVEKPPQSRPERPSSRSTQAPPGLTLRRVRNGWQLTVVTSSPFTAVVPSRRRSERLSVDLVGAGAELSRDSLYVDNGLIAHVRVIPLSATTHRLILEIDRSLEVQIQHAEGTRQLVLLLGSGAGQEEDEPVSRPDAHPREAGGVPGTGREARGQASPQPGRGDPAKDPGTVAAETPTRRTSRARVTLDPGHGGEDPGTIGAHGTREKDVTLQMALRLQRLMQTSGMDVMLTRTRDMQIQLHPRVDLGNAYDSDVFISIHANHTDDPGIAGIETYYFQPRSLPLARAVHRRLVRELGRPDRGIRRNNFVVVKYNRMPAVLVEIGYLSNPGEEKLLTTARYQQQAAEAILGGVKDYFRKHPPGE